jgi:eukaryotic-like serine/threonine-protein kinase
MALRAGDRIGTYEIVAPLGRGGMGEVWRARDANLHRDVAIKTLPEEFRSDGARLARFEREARLLAALNHPGIASIYGLEKRDGTTYLVMELVEGATLAERLAAGALPLDDALAAAAGIATALEAAHGAGIVHRDLKPANVKIRPDGSVKVLDLGLARTFETSRDPDSSLSPTITTPATNVGVILGTAAYMSPEQARGRTLDRRTDIFSFGCVLYECLTGKQAFRGETVSDTLAAILKSEPDWSLLPPDLPFRVAQVLRRCLQKDPNRRLHDVADARLELEEARAEEHSGFPEPFERVAPGHTGRRWAVAGAFAGAAVVAAIWLLARRRAPAPEPPASLSAVLPLPPGERPWTERRSIAISPDGRTVVFTATRDGVVRLFRRDLSARAAEPISGSEGGARPFFSPDGQWLGFVVRNELRKVPLAGGTSVPLCNVPPVTAAGSWTTDGRILFTLGPNTGFYEVPDTGGRARPFTSLDESHGEHAHLYPQILPGGRAVLFTLRLGRDFTDIDGSNVAVLETATGKRRIVLEGASFARYGGGHLVFVRGSSLFSVPFDPSSLTVAGAPVPVSENVALDPAEGTAHFALSSDGTLVFIDGPPVASPTTTVLRLDRQGRETPLALQTGNYFFPRLSPDGRRLALVRFSGLRTAIVVYDRDRQILSTLTPEPGRYVSPVWSPDGERLAFARMLTLRPALSMKNSDGSGEVRALTKGSAEDAELPTSWSPDGKTVAYTVNYGTDRSSTRRALTSDIWLAQPDGSGSAPPAPWFETPFREAGAVFSPDGKWIAYVSEESGVREISVRPFPGPGARIKISTDSGTEPVWTRGGRELVFRTGERLEKFIAVEIQTSPRLSVFPPRFLFSANVNVGGSWMAAVREMTFREYDVSSDGNEFFATRTIPAPEPARNLTVVTNWVRDSHR